MTTFRTVVVFLLVLVASVPAAVCCAKPPDLPADNDVRCEEPDQGQFLFRWDVQTSRLRVEIEANGQPVTDVPMILDVWCPNVVPLLVQRLCQRLLAGAGSAAPIEDESRPKGPVCPDQPVRDSTTIEVQRYSDRDAVRQDDESSETAVQARQFFEMARRNMRAGNFQQAREFLREAHMANPTCLFGRLAMERLQDLESTESCEFPYPVVPESQPRRMTDELPPLEEPPSDDDAVGSAERAFKRARETTQPLGLIAIPTY